jgi:hypothetical protein
MCTEEGFRTLKATDELEMNRLCPDETVLRLLSHGLDPLAILEMVPNVHRASIARLVNYGLYDGKQVTPMGYAIRQYGLSMPDAIVMHRTVHKYDIKSSPVPVVVAIVVSMLKAITSTNQSLFYYPTPLRRVKAGSTEDRLKQKYRNETFAPFLASDDLTTFVCVFLALSRRQESFCAWCHRWHMSSRILKMALRTYHELVATIWDGFLDDSQDLLRYNWTNDALLLAMMPDVHEAFSTMHHDKVLVYHKEHVNKKTGRVTVDYQSLGTPKNMYVCIFCARQKTPCVSGIPWTRCDPIVSILIVIDGWWPCKG